MVCLNFHYNKLKYLLGLIGSGSGLISSISKTLRSMVLHIALRGRSLAETPNGSSNSSANESHERKV